MKYDKTRTTKTKQLEGVDPQKQYSSMHLASNTERHIRRARGPGMLSKQNTIGHHKTQQCCQLLENRDRIKMEMQKRMIERKLGRASFSCGYRRSSTSFSSTISTASGTNAFQSKPGQAEAWWSDYGAALGEQHVTHPGSFTEYHRIISISVKIDFEEEQSFHHRISLVTIWVCQRLGWYPGLLHL